MSVNQKPRRVPTTLTSLRSNPRRGGISPRVSTVRKQPPANAIDGLIVAVSTSPRETLPVTPRGGNAADDIVTLSDLSSPQSPVLEASHPPTPHHPQTDSATKEELVNGVPTHTSGPSANSTNLFAQEEPEKSSENVTDSSRLVEACRCEQTLRFLEGARILRQFNSEIESRQQFLQRELCGQIKLYGERTEALIQKKATYQQSQKSLQNLTRQVRGLDTENDRLQGKLTQLRSAIEKTLSRRTSHQMRQEADLTSSSKNIGAASGVTGRSHSPAGVHSINGKNVRHYSTSAKDLLLAEIDTCNRKIRKAETQQAELSNELGLAAARRKGRAAAYSHWNSLRTASKGTEEFGGGETSGLTESVSVNDLIHYLDRRTSDILTYGN